MRPRVTGTRRDSSLKCSDAILESTWSNVARQRFNWPFRASLPSRFLGLYFLHNFPKRSILEYPASVVEKREGRKQSERKLALSLFVQLLIYQ